MRRPLRTLFWGLTHEHAAGKLASLRKLSDDFEIVAVVDDRARTAPRHLNEVADTTGLRLISEAEADRVDGIDVAFVETANADLMEIAAKFIAKGVPLHCDKPCGEAMEPYRSLVAKCRAACLPFQIGYMYRGNPALQFAWQFVAEGGLGEVAFIEADMNHDYGEPNYPDYIASFKGGILYNLGCHLVDMVLPLVRGDLREAHPFLGDAPGDPAGSRTAGAAFLRFAGTDVLLRTSSRMPGGILCRRLRIDGTNGTLDLCPIERFDGEELKLTLSLKDAAGGFAAGRHAVGFGVQADRYAPQLKELAAVVRGERPNGQDYDRDLRVHELTLQACGLDASGVGSHEATYPPSEASCVAGAMRGEARSVPANLRVSVSPCETLHHAESAEPLRGERVFNAKNAKVGYAKNAKTFVGLASRAFANFALKRNTGRSEKTSKEVI